MAKSKAAESAESTNKVTITDIGPSLKKIHIEIPAASVDEQLGTSVDTLIAEAALPGFRKGRAPKRLVEKKFGSSIRKEAKSALVASAYSKAIEDHKLRVIGEPSGAELDKAEVHEGKPFAFEVEVEVPPTFDMPNLEGITVKKPIVTVEEDMVTKEIDRLLLNEGRLDPKSDPEAGDYLTGHAVMKDEEGKVQLDIQDAVIQIPAKDKDGKGMILGVMVDDFAKQLGTPALHSNVNIHTTGPETHENEAIRGKKLHITFTPKRADAIIPATTEEVATRYGMENADDLKNAMRSRIEQRVQLEQQNAMRQQVAKHLLEGVKMELPHRVTSQQAGRNLERTRLELMHRGVDSHKIEENLAELRASSASSAVNELKLFFILDRIAEEMKINVSEGEINGRISQIALSRGERPEKLRQELISRNQVGTVYIQIREHKTFDAILGKAKVEELSVEEFNKTFGGEKAAKPVKSGGHDSGHESHEHHAAKSESKAAKPKKESAKDEGDDKPKAAKSKKKSE